MEPEASYIPAFCAGSAGGGPYRGARDRVASAQHGRGHHQAAFQRAFAQEFLCPFEDLMEYLQTERPDSDAIERAADQQIGEVASQRPLPEPGGDMATILLVFAPWTLAAVSGVPCTGVSMYSYTLIFMYRWSHVHDKVAVYRP